MKSLDITITKENIGIEMNNLVRQDILTKRWANRAAKVPCAWCGLPVNHEGNIHTDCAKIKERVRHD